MSSRIGIRKTARRPSGKVRLKGEDREPRPPAGVEERMDALDETIGMLKELMRRVVEMADEGKQFEEMVNFMEKFSRAGTRLASLLKAQHDWAGEQDMVGALQEALDDVVEQLSAPGGQ